MVSAWLGFDEDLRADGSTTIGAGVRRKELTQYRKPKKHPGRARLSFFLSFYNTPLSRTRITSIRITSISSEGMTLDTLMISL